MNLMFLKGFYYIPSYDCHFWGNMSILVYWLIHTIFFPIQNGTILSFSPCIIRIGDLIFLIFLSFSYLSFNRMLIGKYGYTFFAASIIEVKGDSKITPAKLLF